MKLRFVTSLVLLLGTAPADAIEQNCRFIQARAEREACYKKQEAELAAMRKAKQQAAASRTLDTVQQMRRDDADVYRSMRGICRGC